MHFVVVDADVGVSVDLDEPDAEVLVNHEVEPEEFKGVAALAGVHGVLGAEEAVKREVLHPKHEVALEVEPVVPVLLLEELLELLQGDRVALLVLPVVLRVLHLQAVVRQVDVLVVQVLRLVLEA